MKVTTLLDAWYSLLLFVSGQVLAITWDFNKQADVEDWEGPDAQRKTCKWTIDLKEGVFQAKGLADEGTAFVKKTAWKDDWLDYTLEVKVRNMGTKNHFGIGFRENRVGHHYGFYMNDFAGAETKYWFGIWNGGYTALAGSWGEDGNYKDAEEWNTMKVVVKGFHFDLYINGKLLKKVEDKGKTFKSGPVALVSDKHQEVAIAQFDYVKVEGDGIPMAVSEVGKLAVLWAKIRNSD